MVSANNQQYVVRFPVPSLFLFLDAESGEFSFPRARVRWFLLWRGCFSPCGEVCC